MGCLAQHAYGVPPEFSNGARIDVSRLEIIILDPTLSIRWKTTTPFSSDQSGSSTPIMWDPFQEIQIATSYNEIWQPTSDFYSSIQTSNPFLDSYSGCAAIERISGIVTEADIHTKNMIKSMRRRAQNRASQRAFRERQRKTKHELEQQISEWEQKHRALSESHSTLTEEVDSLKAYIGGLISYIVAQQIGLPQCGTQLAQLPEEFASGAICSNSPAYERRDSPKSSCSSGIAPS